MNDVLAKSIPIVCPAWCRYIVLSITAALATSFQSASESEIKAVFIYNFTQFIEWPSSSFKNDDAPLVIAVVGNKQMASLIDKAVRGERAASRKIEVISLNKIEELPDCQLIFIDDLEKIGIPDILEKAKDNKILTISDAEGFAQRGGTIEFFRENGKIRFIVNLESARKTDLKLSSKLLRISKIIQ